MILTTTSPSPYSLPAGLPEALDRLARTPRLLVAIDFDGTLAPFTDDPLRSRALPDSHLALIALWKIPATKIALVSGRALDSLRIVADPPKGTILVGSHGVEMQMVVGEDPDLQLTTQEITDVSDLNELLDEVAEDHNEVWVEHKPAGAVLHTRGADSAEAQEAEHEALADTEDEFSSLLVRPGKDVLEFSVREANKGEALRELRRRTHATGVFYAGDDLTDEDAFAVLRSGDVGVHAGYSGRTRAPFQVPGPAQITVVLQYLASVRAAVSRQTATMA